MKFCRKRVTSQSSFSPLDLFSLSLSSSSSSSSSLSMDEIKPREEEKSKSRRNVICRKTGDHVHYPRNRKTRSTRISHAPSSSSSASGLESLFRLARKKRYGECRKNQAAEIGTTAYDGCGEFVAAGEEDSVNCIACGCHRNFHREELISENDVTETVLTRSPPHAVLEMLKISSDQFRQIFCSPYGERKKEKEDRIVVDRVAEGEGRMKRFKTKFTAEQTEKMRINAEKLEWKMNRENEEEVDKICLEIGVMKNKFRSWMNNHKDKS